MRVVLLGGGYWGKNLARNLDALASLYGICDQSVEQLQVFKQQYSHIKTYTDWNVVIADTQVEAIVIATPPETHFTIALAALTAGKDVYVEKPLCHSSAEAEQLHVAAAEYGRVLMVGHLLQYHAVLRRMRHMVEGGELGTVRYIEARRLNIGKIYTERNVLWNFAPHDLSLVLAMAGSRLPQTVSCQGHHHLDEKVADAATITLRFAGGVTAHIQISWISPVKEASLMVYGSEGCAVFNDVRPWHEKLEHFPGHNAVTDGRQGRAVLPDPAFIDVEQGEPLKEEIAHFLACCGDRSEPLTGASEAVRVIAVLDAAQRSMDGHGMAIGL